MQVIDGVRVWGEPDESTLAQAKRCAAVGNVAATALMADAHKGYSMPIGGVIAYRNAVSPSGVGYDIACGIRADRTDIRVEDIRADLPLIADEIASQVAFGLGSKNPTPLYHSLFDDPTWKDEPIIQPLFKRAREQLGSVGSGNHFVDLLEDEDGYLWVAAHFGSRGFGHGVASGFLNLAAGRDFYAKAPGESMDQDPTVIPLDSELGQSYWACMHLAGRYAYAGRDYVVGQVLGILGAESEETVHNCHNFAQAEEHDGEKVVVVRKGATPAFPGQTGFVGGSMGDYAAIVAGIDSEENRLALRSTVHGAGRIMSRSAAKGNRKGNRKGLITRQMMSEWCHKFGVIVRGGDVDESPHVYRPLSGVLEAHSGSIEVLHRLRPVVVVMAGADVYDPYKD